MVKYPLSFKVKAQSEAGISQLWKTSALAVDQELKMAIPPEFAGPGGGFSPEDIYALALANCFVATFKVFAEKSKLTFQQLDVDLELLVDRDEAGRPWMAESIMSVKLSGPSSAENALRLLNKTKESCLILNSVKTHKKFEFVIDGQVMNE